jgi:hypothetical protein
MRRKGFRFPNGIPRARSGQPGCDCSICDSGEEKESSVTGNLRDRIAAALKSLTGPGSSGDLTYEGISDMLIAELGLRVEHGQRSKPDGPLWGSDNRYTVHRWVTDWRADDE